MNTTNIKKRVEQLENINNPQKPVLIVTQQEFDKMTDADKNRYEVIIIDNIPADFEFPENNGERIIQWPGLRKYLKDHPELSDLDS